MDTFLVFYMLSGLVHIRTHYNEKSDPDPSQGKVGSGSITRKRRISTYHQEMSDPDPSQGKVGSGFITRKSRNQIYHKEKSDPDHKESRINHKEKSDPDPYGTSRSKARFNLMKIQ